MTTLSELQDSPRDGFVARVSHVLSAPPALWESVVLVVLIVATIGVAAVAPPGKGLDPTWQIIVTSAIREAARWGRDFIFTYGPYGDQITRTCGPGMCVRMVLVSIFTTTIYAVTLVRMFGRSRQLAYAAVALIIFVNPLIGHDAFYFHACLLFALDEVEHRSLGWLAVKCTAMAVMSLIKLSFLPLVIGLTIFIDARRLLSRKLPIAVPVTAVAIAVAWLFVGQRLGDLLPTVASLRSVVGGYADAMSLWGENEREVVVFIAIVALAGGPVALSMSLMRDRPSALLLGLSIALTTFVSFKAGFVRHDGHSLTAWQTIELNGVVVALSLVVATAHWQRWVGLGFLAGTVVLAASTPSIFPQAFFPVNALRPQWPQRRTIMAHTLTDLASVRSSEARFTEKLNKAPSLVHFDGVASVDSTSWVDPQALIAAGVYKPRPSPAEYAAYTAELLERNRDFFASNDAPEQFNFALETIDGRLPAGIEGASWPTLLERYEPKEIERGVLVLQRRATSAQVVLHWGEPREVRLGEWFDVATDETPVFATIDIRPTLQGVLKGLAYKRQSLDMECRTRSGLSFSNRIIPSMARAGFIISPYIDTATTMLGLWKSQDFRKALVSQLVVCACRITPRLPTHNWSHTIVFHQSHVELTPVSTTPIPDEERKLAYQQVMTELVGSKVSISVPPPIFDGDGVYAHAPSQLGLAVNDANAFDIEFGLREGAWEEPYATDGVIFSIRDANDVSRVLWSSMLQPTGKLEDRERKQAHVGIPPGVTRVIFETACGDNCARDWSYWYSVRRLH